MGIGINIPAGDIFDTFFTLASACKRARASPVLSAAVLLGTCQHGHVLDGDSPAKNALGPFSV